MSKITSGNFLHSAAVAVAGVSLMATLGLTVAQAYVRWTINQNFTFLGGFQLEALTAASFALLIALIYLARKY